MQCLAWVDWFPWNQTVVNNQHSVSIRLNSFIFGIVNKCNQGRIEPPKAARGHATSSSVARSSSNTNAADRMPAISKNHLAVSAYTSKIWILYLLTLSILPSMNVACPLTAFGGLMHPWCNIKVCSSTKQKIKLSLEFTLKAQSHTNVSVLYLYPFRSESLAHWIILPSSSTMGQLRRIMCTTLSQVCQTWSYE